MNVLILIALICSQFDYATAHARATTSGNCLIVVVTADWCQYCERPKRLLRKYPGIVNSNKRHTAIVDIDRQPKLAAKVLQGITGLPAVVRYCRRDGVWVRDVPTPEQVGEMLDWLESTPTLMEVK